MTEELKAALAMVDCYDGDFSTREKLADDLLKYRRYPENALETTSRILVAEVRRLTAMVESSGCPIADSVALLVRSRAKTGLLKYGVNLTRKDLSDVQWLQHLQDELLDAAGYAERLKLDLRQFEGKVGP